MSNSIARNLQHCVRKWVSLFFATLTISYIPDEKIIESKSLKLYLFSFRNHGDFHEDCINIIMNDLIKLIEPRYIEVWGKLRLVAAYLLTLIATMENLERNTNKWQITG